MEYYADRLCISHEELTGYGIMSEQTVKNLRHRQQLQQVRRGCFGTPALFAVDSLPLRFRAEVYRRRPDVQEKADSQPFLDSIHPDGAAIAFFADFTFTDGRHLKAEKQMEYANNCAILNTFGQVLERSDSHRMRQSKRLMKPGDFWRKAAAALPRLADDYPHSLPQNWRRLREKFNEYRRDGYESMISRKFQNTNASKVMTEQQTATLTQLLSHHNNLDNVTIAKLYNTIASQMQWKHISASAVGVWREKTDLITAGGRRGATNFRSERSMQVKRSRPTAPFLLWTLDGWDCELLYQSTKTDKNGHNLTTYSNRLTLEVVLDPCCDYPIGYAVGTHETPELIREALRNAAQHSRELFGEMLRTNQLQCDHYAIKAMSPLYGVMADKVTPARVKNAKAKVVEPYFGHLNKTYCKLCQNWSGYGITTDSKRQPNSEALNMLRHSFPDEQGVREQIDNIIAAERRSKIGRLRELMEQLPVERRLPLSKENYLLNFGCTTGHTNALEGQGLRPTLLGIKRTYDSWDIGFRSHASAKWTVYYDENDLGEVLAVNEDGTLRYMLHEKEVQPMALANRKPGDAAALARVRQFNRELENHVCGRLAEAWHQVDTMLQDNPQLDILRRHLLLDSTGQHKLPKARARLQTIQDAEEVPLVPRSAPESDKDDYSIF